MFNKYGERTQPCRIPFLTRNHSDIVPATLTLASCFLYSLASKSIKCREYPRSIIVTRSLSRKRVERLEVHKAHIEWLLVLACLVHQYSVIRDLISCPPALSKSRLFICNFRFGLYSDLFQYDPKKDLACMGDKSNCFVICTLFNIAFLGKWDECAERIGLFLWPLTSFADRHIYSVHSVQYRLSSGITTIKTKSTAKRVCEYLLWLLFICHDIIHFLHNSAFQVQAAMCTAGRPHFSMHSIWGMVSSDIFIN